MDWQSTIGSPQSVRDGLPPCRVQGKEKRRHLLRERVFPVLPAKAVPFSAPESLKRLPRVVPRAGGPHHHDVLGDVPPPDPAAGRRLSAQPGRDQGETARKGGDGAFVCSSALPFLSLKHRLSLLILRLPSRPCERHWKGFRCTALSCPRDPARSLALCCKRWARSGRRLSW